MTYRERMGWMLSGALIAIFVLFGCNVVSTGVEITPTAARGEAQEQARDVQDPVILREVPPDQTPGQEAPPAQGGAELGNVISQLYEQANPSVVQIDVATGQGGGLGTGFVIDKQGHIVTNYHVVANAQQVVVTFLDQENYIGEVIGFDRDSDLAVVRVRDIDPSLLVPVELGDSSTLRVGEIVVAIGNPLGESRTATMGIISALRPAKRETNDPNDFLIPGVIQTDAAINPGNSGGPLFDSRGRVIGVNTFIANPGGTGANIGIGYAVPVNLVKKVAPALIEQGRYVHPFLGVGMDTVSRLAAQQNNLPSKGVLIASITRGGPAEEAGLREGDLIVAVNGTDVATSEDVIAYLEFNTRPGDTATFTVVEQNGQRRDVPVVIGERPSR